MLVFYHVLYYDSHKCKMYDFTYNDNTNNTQYR
jgi:hypothetical protein